jgi:hypothetical protein
VVNGRGGGSRTGSVGLGERRGYAHKFKLLSTQESGCWLESASKRVGFKRTLTFGSSPLVPSIGSSTQVRPVALQPSTSPELPKSSASHTARRDPKPPSPSTPGRAAPAAASATAATVAPPAANSWDEVSSAMKRSAGKARCSADRITACTAKSATFKKKEEVF